jgi:tRNA(fMet)-specific endonuclease VapC
MITYALDSNIVSYFLKKDPVILQKIHEEYDRGNQFVIPPLVYFEIQHWLVKNNSKIKRAVFEEVYVDEGIGVIDKAVLDIAVTERLKLAKKGFSIDDNDLLIAAYCIKQGLPLVTNNIKHFINIENLNIVNWKE